MVVNTWSPLSSDVITLQKAIPTKETLDQNQDAVCPEVRQQMVGASVFPVVHPIFPYFNFEHMTPVQFLAIRVR